MTANFNEDSPGHEHQLGSIIQGIGRRSEKRRS